MEIALWHLLVTAGSLVLAMILTAARASSRITKIETEMRQIKERVSESSRDIKELEDKSSDLRADMEVIKNTVNHIQTSMEQGFKEVKELIRNK
jgi:archaellum component FlaC